MIAFSQVTHTIFGNADDDDALPRPDYFAGGQNGWQVVRILPSHLPVT
jgi:hypothetical protein